MELIEDIGVIDVGCDRKRRHGVFLCGHCNNIVTRKYSDGKKQKSCGCAKSALIAKANTKHSECGTRLHRIWMGIKARCLCVGQTSYNIYGGRGINVCDEWLNYVHFKKWALCNGYREGLEVDRINNDLGYAPTNCRWVDHKTNSRNKRILARNTSGVCGVHWDVSAQKWKAEIMANYRKINLGRFNCFEKAKQARLNAEKCYWSQSMHSNIPKERMV